MFSECAPSLVGTADLELKAPKFLKTVAPEAEVNASVLAILDDFLVCQGGERGLGDTIKKVTGERVTF